MGRFSAAAYGAAFFLIAICVSPLALAGEDCESRNSARLDVTSAVDTAISFVVTTVRKLKPSYDVQIVEALYESARTGRPVQLSLPEKKARPSLDQEETAPPVRPWTFSPTSASSSGSSTTC